MLFTLPFDITNTYCKSFVAFVLLTGNLLRLRRVSIFIAIREVYLSSGLINLKTTAARAAPPKQPTR